MSDVTHDNLQGLPCSGFIDFLWVWAVKLITLTCHSSLDFIFSMNFIYFLIPFCLPNYIGRTY